MDKTVTYFGILRSITSWAKVSREMLSALVKLGVPVNVYERKGFLYDERFGLDYTIKSRITNAFKGDVVFTFENPRAYEYLPESAYRIGFLVYEFTKLPELWVESINSKLDKVVVPSDFCRRVFVGSGVEEKKVVVLRYGFNPEFYYPRKSTNKNGAFTFLCAAAPHKREGVELLLESYSKAFGASDRVELVLKLTYVPRGRPKSFEYSDIMGLIESKTKSGSAPIRVVTERLSEAQMGELYRGADCYFSMTKGEAFGLCFLEALACGLPVASVKWGGQCDFLNEDNAYFIRHSLMPLKDEKYEGGVKGAEIVLPDASHASEVMSRIYADSRRHAVGLADTGYLSGYKWDKIAEDFAGILGI
ncbi:MAG: glycosyltransferase family 4 protein [Endomicrobiales bacterium]|nr:glycosyltransferase family 4 protein [Endomicrobiales bacterium]